MHSLLLSAKKIEGSWKETKTKHHSMHHLCSRICSFPVSIPEYYIRTYTKRGDVVFDPWSGKGTVPFEALRNGRIGIGNDKSPEAFILTHAKVRPIRYSTFERYVLLLGKKINRMRSSDPLTELDRRAKVFYSEKTFEQILKLKKVIKDDKSKTALFTKAIVLSLLHGSSTNTFSLQCSHSYAMSPPYVKKYAKQNGLRRPKRDVIQCILNKGKLILADEQPTIRGIAINCDSTDLKLKSESVNMILTSPPYFDIQTYAWANWLRLWFLGFDYREIRKTLAESGDMEVYRNFMQKSIFELFRVLKSNGRCFIVVGDLYLTRGKKKVFVNTAEFLKPLCLNAGFKLERIVRDTIPRTKKVNTYVTKDQGIKVERILYLRKF